jgi:integrase
MSPEFVAFAERRNRESQKVTTPASAGTFEQLADIYRGVPIFGVIPSKAQIALDPARYAVGRPEQVAPSQEWLDLEPRTRKDYTRFVDRILVLWRHELVTDLEVEMVTEMRDARRGTPRMANYMLNVLNAMLSLALQKKRTFGISANVAANVTRFGVKAGVKPRRVYWTYEDEKRFLDDADQTDPVMALGQRLLAFTGQRPGDTRTMMLTDYDGEKIRVVQSKTKARVWIKCHKDLKPYLETAIAEARAAGVANGAFLRGVRGEPMGERYFATRWDAVASRTRTLHLNRQDLRRTAVVRLAEADCTVPQIAAITGHSLKQVEGIMETYFVRTYEMGAAAITKLEVHQDRLKDERN